MFTATPRDAAGAQVADDPFEGRRALPPGGSRHEGKATAAAYDSDLHRLVALAGMNTVLAFTPDLVRLYFTTESQRGNGMSTLHRKLSTLREFAKWGRKHRLWATDPTLHFPTIKRPKHKPRPFEHGVDVRLVKDLLGHEDIKSTVIYTQVTDAALSAAVLRLSWSL